MTKYPGMGISKMRRVWLWCGVVISSVWGSAYAADVTVFTSAIEGTPGCVYSNAPTNTHICCEGGLFSVTTGATKLAGTSFGKICQDNGKVVGAYSQESGGAGASVQAVCGFKIGKQRLTGHKWTCLAAPLASTPHAPLVPTAPGGNAGVPDCPPAKQGTPTVPIPELKQIIVAVAPNVPPPASRPATHPVPKPAKKIKTKTAKKPQKQTVPKTEYRLAGLTPAQAANVKAMLSRGCQFSRIGRYANSALGRETDFYGFCCAQLQNSVNPTTRQFSAAPTFSPDCNPEKGFQPILNRYGRVNPDVARDPSVPLDSLPIVSCTYQGKIPGYEQYPNPPGEVTYCAYKPD